MRKAVSGEFCSSDPSADSESQHDISRIVERIKRVSGFVVAHPLESARGALVGFPSVRQVYALEETQRPGELEMVVELFERDPRVEAKILEAVRRAVPPATRPIVTFRASEDRA